MDIILYIILSVYFLEHLILFIGVLKNKKAPAVSYTDSNYPFISLIVAGRNEEKNISRTIESLLRLDYPKDKLEVILVNDNSEDLTGEIMQSYLKNNSHFRYILTGNLESRLKGKTRALANAIKQSQGEFIFTTDADTIVKPTWLKEMVSYFDEQTGVVSGYSIMENPKNLNSGIQGFDWLYLLSIAAGADGIDNQISCVGNNMGYRRSAYDEVGGYENIKFSVTEDFMLLQTIRKKTKWKTRFPVNNKTVNYTLPCNSFIELYRQKKRWAKGGLDSDSLGITAGIVAFVGSALVLFGWLLFGWKAYFVFLAGKILADIIFTLVVVSELKSWKLYLYFIPFEIYFTLYVFTVPFILLLDRKVIWKNQKF